jgi:hypothetical protein
MDRNEHLLSSGEQVVVERFRIHVIDLENRHLNHSQACGGQMYPRDVDMLFSEMRDVQV